MTKAAGGDYRGGPHGRYIAWPATIQVKNKPAILTATKIGKHFELSSQKMNYILSEPRWIKKALKGWEVTDQGRRIGAAQDEDKKSGVPYVRWPDDILTSKTLANTVAEVKGTEGEQPTETAAAKDPEDVGFREKFEAKHRSADGH